MKRMLTGLQAAALAAGLALTAASPAPAATYKLKIGAGHPAASAWIATIRDFYMPKVAERVAKETGNKIEWTEAWGGSVCKLGECIEAVESGLLDIGELQNPFEPSKLLAHNFTYFAPFGTPDPRLAAKTIWEVYEKTPALKRVLETRYNQVYLGAGVIGNYGLITTFKWNNVSDLKGHKIAAAGPNLPWLVGTGVVGVQSNLNEAYTSFQTGVYEGWVMFADAIISFKLNEVTKQFVDMHFGAIHTPLLTMNKDTWKELPPNVQKIFLEVAKDWNEYIGRTIHEKQEAALVRMKETGIDVRPATFEMKQAWAKTLPNIPKQRFDEINKAGLPGEVIYTYIKALKAAGHKFPRDWEAER